MNANPSNSGFEGLHNSTGVLLVLVGFGLVGIFILAGAIVSRGLERENQRKREIARQEAKDAKH